MSLNRFPSALVAPIAVIAVLVAGCNLSDPLDGTGPPTGEPDADAGPTDAGRDVDVPDDVVVDDDTGTDMEGEDMPPNEDTGPDMPGDLTVAEFFDRYVEEYCTALERLDLQFNDFYWWESLDDCTATLYAILGTEPVFLAHDAAMDRVALDQDAAEAALATLAAIDHPADFDALAFDDLFTARAGPYEPCASDESCIDDDVSYSCLKQSSTDCEGICAPFAKRCGDVVCLEDEYCESTDNCVAKKADGETCSVDRECQKLCLSAGAGARVCGALDVGEACVMNPDGCRAGLFCDPDAATPSCRARVADGENCTVDNACLPDSFCDGGTCTPMDEGTACRNNARCPEGLRCVPINAVDPDRGCFAERREGEPCSTDAMCPDTHYCDSTQNPAVCQPRGGIGEPCRFSDECSGQLTCRRADSMSQGTCEQWSWGLSEGETCFEAAAVCGWGLYCEKDGPDSRRGTCTMRPRPTTGESCLEPLECVDGYCDSGSDQCEPQGVIGEACASATDCRSLVCSADTNSCIARNDVCP